MKKLIVVLFISLNYSGSFAQTAAEFYQTAFQEHSQENYKAALKSIDKAIGLDPLNAEYQTFKGSILMEMELPREAYAAFCTAIELDKTFAHAYCGRAILETNVGMTDQAIRDYGYAMEYAETDSIRFSYQMNRGVAYSTDRNFEEAYVDLLACYRFDSTHLATLNNLATVCSDLGNDEEALKYLFRVLEADPKFDGAYTNIGFIYQRLNRHQEAISYFDKVISLSPEDGIAYNNRSYSKLQLKDIKGALSDVERSIRLYPENAYAYRNRALIFLAQGKANQACEDLNMAVRLGFTKMYGHEVEALIRENCGY